MNTVGEYTAERIALDVNGVTTMKKQIAVRP